MGARKGGLEKIMLWRGPRRRGKNAVAAETRKVKRKKNINNNKTARVYIIILHIEKTKRRRDSGARANNGREGIQIIIIMIIRWKD